MQQRIYVCACRHTHTQYIFAILLSFWNSLSVSGLFFAKCVWHIFSFREIYIIVFTISRRFILVLIILIFKSHCVSSNEVCKFCYEFVYQNVKAFVLFICVLKCLNYFHRFLKFSERLLSDVLHSQIQFTNFTELLLMCNQNYYTMMNVKAWFEISLRSFYCIAYKQKKERAAFKHLVNNRVCWTYNKCTALQEIWCTSRK